MRNWLVGIGVGLVVMVASWALLVLLARRLPPGPLRELARFIPDCVTAVRRLRGDPRVPRRAKVAVLLAGLAGQPHRSAAAGRRRGGRPGAAVGRPDLLDGVIRLRGVGMAACS